MLKHSDENKLWVVFIRKPYEKTLQEDAMIRTHTGKGKHNAGQQVACNPNTPAHVLEALKKDRQEQ